MQMISQHDALRIVVANYPFNKITFINKMREMFTLKTTASVFFAYKYNTTVYNT